MLGERIGEDVVIWCLESEEITRALSRKLEACPLVGGSSSSPYHGAAMIWWPISEEHPTVPSRLVLDRSGVYGEAALEQLAQAIAAGPPRTNRPLVRPSDELIEHERTRRVQAEREVRTADTENRLLREQIKEERRKRSKLKRELEKVRPSKSDGPKPEGIEVEIAARWIRSYMESGRSLPAFTVGSHFEESIESCDLVDREVAIDVAARLLTDITGSLEVHKLRTGSGGNDPQKIRDGDGAKAYRCAVKRNSPGAPRMHFWKLPNGMTELAQIAHHDEHGIKP